MRTTFLLSSIFVGAVAVGSARQGLVPSTPLSPPTPSAPTAPTLPAPLPMPPIDQRPDALMQAQQLAMAAYPELRTMGLQLRVEDGADGPIVTFADASHDREDVLGLGRPRPALLVVETTFDVTRVLTRAILRGSLARSLERRRIRALVTGWTKALEDDGATFPPTRQAAFLKQLDLTALKNAAGALTMEGAQFQPGTDDDGMYWQITAATPAGEAVTLGFEPYGGRLVRFVKGGVQ